MFFLESSLDIHVILEDIHWNSRLIFLTNTTNRMQAFPNHLPDSFARNSTTYEKLEHKKYIVTLTFRVF